MIPVIYQCPVTGLMVEHRFAPASQAGAYETAACRACNETHEIHSIRLLHTPTWWSNGWRIFGRVAGTDPVD